MHFRWFYWFSQSKSASLAKGTVVFCQKVQNWLKTVSFCQKVSFCLKTSLFYGSFWQKCVRNVTFPGFSEMCQKCHFSGFSEMSVFWHKRVCRIPDCNRKKPGEPWQWCPCSYGVPGSGPVVGCVVPGVWGTGTRCGPWCHPVVRVREPNLQCFPTVTPGGTSLTVFPHCNTRWDLSDSQIPLFRLKSTVFG